MFFDSNNIKAFVFKEAVDMRRGHNGLSFLVTHSMHLDLLSGAIFLFVGKNRKVLKCLTWDGTGLVLIHKKMENHKIMSFVDLDEISSITTSELSLIFQGARIKLPLSPKRVEIDLEV